MVNEIINNGQCTYHDVQNWIKLPVITADSLPPISVLPSRKNSLRRCSTRAACHALMRMAT